MDDRQVIDTISMLTKLKDLCGIRFTSSMDDVEICCVPKQAYFEGDEKEKHKDWIYELIVKDKEKVVEESDLSPMENKEFIEKLLKLTHRTGFESVKVSWNHSDSVTTFSEFICVTL